MNRLPSYGEAVEGAHWLTLVAPYVAVQDYARLCRVSRRFYDEFAPRLWKDPLQATRLLGLRPLAELDWFVYFVTRRSETVREATRQLVTSLNFERPVQGSPTLVAGLRGRTFSSTVWLFLARFPAVRCILLDGLRYYDPADFLRTQKAKNACCDGSVPMPRMLSLAHCHMPLPNTFFRPPYWNWLLYVDLSDMPGSLACLTHDNASAHQVLPRVQIVRIRDRELKDASILPVLDALKKRVWSLDLSRNDVTDRALHALIACFYSDATIQTDLYWETEGKVAPMQDAQGQDLQLGFFGRSKYLAESPQSRTFSHPERYYADSPAYDPNVRARLNGREAPRSDRPEKIRADFAGSVRQTIPDWHDVERLGANRARRLTHIHLSGNKRISVNGLRCLFWMAQGNIECFDCAAPAIPTPSSIKSGFTLAGALGCAHLFRPALASNLQQLRIHHSLVTQVPTVTEASLRATERLRFAETTLRERAEIAFPQAFVPDMNPRLQSLTLTCVPRLSTGPVLERLIRFLQLAAQQEQDIRAMAPAIPRKSALVLRGLRHIRLEFEAYPEDGENGDAGGLDDLDAGALLRMSDNEFSFFGPSAWAESAPPKENNVGPESSPAAPPPTDTGEPGKPSRYTHYPLPGRMAEGERAEYVLDTIFGVDDKVDVHVWVGSGIPGAHQAVDVYMANLANPLLRTNIEAATPEQVLAGVPEGTWLYQAAWDAILFSERCKGPPPYAHAMEMQDVVEAIRAFRASTRTAGGYWTGLLEIL